MADSGPENPGDPTRDRPLADQGVIITRAKAQTTELQQALVHCGARVFEAPTIQILEPEDWAPLDQALGQFESYQWLVFTSANGVEAAANRFEYLAAAPGWPRPDLSKVRIAAIGGATATAVQCRLGRRPDLVPPKALAESLAEELLHRNDLRGRRVLMLRADIARPTLPQRLREAGAEVTDVAAYRTRAVEALPPAVLAAMRAEAADWITFTSASTARGLVQLLGAERRLLDPLRVASIGPITSAALRELGFEADAEAETADVAGLVDALVTATTR